MANFIFGDTDEIVCQHSLGEFRFSPKANESSTIDKGGVRANDDASQVTSNGQMMSQLNRVLWSWECPIAVDTISDNEMTNLAKLAAHPELGIWTFSLLSGTIYKGKGRPVGDLQADSNAGTMTLKVAGGGVLEKI
jgi:hypothetical protein